MSTTLSRAVIELSRTTGPARRATAPYLLHQSVADLFGDRDERGYLFRVLRERPATRQRPATYVVLVLSAAEPLPLTELRDWPHRRTVALESKPFEPHLRAGQLLDFEIRLNATRVVTEETAGPADKTKKRRDLWEAVWEQDDQTPLSPHDVYGGYLAGRLAGAAEVLEARVTERGEVRARPASVTAKGEHSAVFVATNLIGTLLVEQPEALIATIAAGIGRGKAFGCGLLCLSRPGTVLPRRGSSLAAEPTAVSP